MLTKVKKAIDDFYKVLQSQNSDKDDKSKKAYINVFDKIIEAAKEEEQFIAPIEFVSDGKLPDLSQLKPGDEFKLSDDLKMNFLKVSLNNKNYYAVFTSDKESGIKNPTSSITVDIEEFLNNAFVNDKVKGIIINPFSNKFVLDQLDIEHILAHIMDGFQSHVIKMVNKDITTIKADSIINFTTKTLISDETLSKRIYQVAGEKLIDQLKESEPIKISECLITDGYDLKSKHIIHTVIQSFSEKSKDKFMSTLRRACFNSLQLARENKLHLVAFNEIPMDISCTSYSEAVKVINDTIRQWCRINMDYQMEIILACNNEKSFNIYKDVNNALGGDNFKFEYDLTENIEKIDETIEYATNVFKDKHKENLDIDLPYITYSISIFNVLREMNADPNLLIASLLIGSLDDKKVKLIDIYDKYGYDVTKLVNFCREDNSHTWLVNKYHTIFLLDDATEREKMLVMAKAIVDLRLMLDDYHRYSDKMWEKLVVPKALFAWYYDQLDNSFQKLLINEKSMYFESIEPIYYQMLALIKDLFVEYYENDDGTKIYQSWMSGHLSCIEKNDPYSKEIKSLKIPKEDNCHRIVRKYAERLEDNWVDEFEDKILQNDLKDNVYMLKQQAEDNTSITNIWKAIRIKDRCISFIGNILLTEDKIDEAKVYAKLNKYNSKKFIHTLYEISEDVLTDSLFKDGLPQIEKIFNYFNLYEDFVSFCKEHDIEFEKLNIDK